MFLLETTGLEGLVPSLVSFSVILAVLEDLLNRLGHILGLLFSLTFDFHTYSESF